VLLVLELTGISLAKRQEIHARNARRYRTMLLEKKRLSFDEIEAQTALELPGREMLALITVVITNLLNNLSVSVRVQNVNVAVQVCAIVDLINTILVGESLRCDITQR
jgi:hypothetical protein